MTFGKMQRKRKLILNESILQFGSGRFLRAFVDLFIHESRLAGENIGKIVIVQSTGNKRVKIFTQQNYLYHVHVRGIFKEAEVDKLIQVSSVSRALSAQDDWDSVLAVGRNPSTEYIISNTSEIGYNVPDSEWLNATPPRSFPAKLTRVLWDRFENGGAPITIIPCELIDDNAKTLKVIVKTLAKRFNLTDGFLEWLDYEVSWLNTLVDRITIDPPTSYNNPRQDDRLITLTEPFAFWAIEDNKGPQALIQHPALIRTHDVRSYALRKMRVLNGAHTALVARALPIGIKTVREAVEHPEIGPWLRELIFQELVPALPDDTKDVLSFAENCIERFRNPYLDHLLTSIAVEHETKVQIRLRPTFYAYLKKFKRQPPLLSSIITINSEL